MGDGHDHIPAFARNMEWFKETDNRLPLGLADQNRFLLEVMDKNQLYVNTSQIDETDYQVGEEDDNLNR